jgi:hypothetical protein
MFSHPLPNPHTNLGLDSPGQFKLWEIGDRYIAGDGWEDIRQPLANGGFQNFYIRSFF